MEPLMCFTVTLDYRRHRVINPLSPWQRSCCLIQSGTGNETVPHHLWWLRADMWSTVVALTNRCEQQSGWLHITALLCLTPSLLQPWFSKWGACSSYRAKDKYEIWIIANLGGQGGQSPNSNHGSKRSVDQGSGLNCECVVGPRGGWGADVKIFGNLCCWRTYTFKMKICIICLKHIFYIYIYSLYLICCIVFY